MSGTKKLRTNGELFKFQASWLGLTYAEIEKKSGYQEKAIQDIASGKGASRSP